MYSLTAVRRAQMRRDPGPRSRQRTALMAMAAVARATCGAVAAIDALLPSLPKADAHHVICLVQEHAGGECIMPAIEG